MMVMTKQMRKNSNMFDTKRVFSVYRATDAVSNHKRVNPLRINVKTSSTLNIGKKLQPNLEYV